MPNFGTLITEGFVGLVELARIPLNLLVNLPGLIPVWISGSVCTHVTGGHSLLQTCGVGILSMDAVFDSVQVVNAQLWRTFSMLAQIIRNNDEDTMANVVDGAAILGAATAEDVFRQRILQTVTASVASPVNTLSNVITKMMPMQFAALRLSPVSAAKWFAKLVVDCLMDIIRLVNHI
jgi:hypothetical protein